MRIVQPIVAIVRRQSVWLAVDSALIARNPYAETASVNAKSAARCFVNRVWKITYV